MARKRVRLDDQVAQRRAAVLADALPWINKNAGKTFVIKYGGSAMEDPELCRQVIADVVLMKLVGIRVVLVHGGGKAISALMKELDLKVAFKDGLRVTDDAAMRAVQMALVGEVNQSLISQMNAYGDYAVGITGADGRTFEAEAKNLGDVSYLAQGTIYPDVVESGTGGAGAVIKSHHNVGGLPKELSFTGLVEPLRPLFKDEVRDLGRKLGLPESIVSRQPFPGPGLGVRIVGEVTEDKVRIVQEADAIFQEELARFGVDTGSGQFFAALSNLRSVGVMGDGRTYDYAVVLRAVRTEDFMTAAAARLPYELLDVCMNRIINEVSGVNRVLYDLTSKPPATIELE